MQPHNEDSLLLSLVCPQQEQESGSDLTRPEVSPSSQRSICQSPLNLLEFSEVGLVEGRNPEARFRRPGFPCHLVACDIEHNTYFSALRFHYLGNGNNISVL